MWQFLQNAMFSAKCIGTHMFFIATIFGIIYFLNLTSIIRVKREEKHGLFVTS